MTRGRRPTLIPAQLAHLEWPMPSAAQLQSLTPADRQLYEQRKRAVDGVRARQRFRAITQQSGLSRSEIRRLVTRCIQWDVEGNLWGYRALVPNVRQKAYTRTAPLPDAAAGTRGGYAGAWQQLLDDMPGLEDAIEDWVFPPERRDGPQPLDFDEIWGQFELALLEAGRTEADYPLRCAERGKRSLHQHIAALLDEHPERTARQQGGTTAGQRWQMVSPTKKRLIRPRRPGTFAILDFHLCDARTTFILTSPTGEPYAITVPRWYIGVLVDEHLGAILAVTATLELNPSAADTLQTLDCMVHPERYVQADLNGLTLDDSKIFLQQMVPEHANASISVLRLDNAWANAADAVIRNAVYTFGTCVHFGPSRCWVGRPMVERVIKELAIRGAQIMPSSTGATPGSGLHGDAAEQAELFDVRIEDLMCTLLRVAREHNATRTERLAHSSADFVLRQAYLDPDRPLPGMRLPQATRESGTLLQETFIATVRGNVKKGVRPHINWERRRFSNAMLDERADLIGRDLLCTVPYYDCDVMHAVVLDTSTALGRFIPDRRYDPPRSIRMNRLLRVRGRRAQLKQRATSARAKALDKAQQRSKRKRHTDEPKDALTAARAAQDARRFPEQEARPTATPYPVQSANDDLKGWIGTQDPFGLATFKRRRPV